jgi:hypothetical protein
MLFRGLLRSSDRRVGGWFQRRCITEQALRHRCWAVLVRGRGSASALGTCAAGPAWRPPPGCGKCAGGGGSGRDGQLGAAGLRRHMFD